MRHLAHPPKKISNKATINGEIQEKRAIAAAPMAKIPFLLLALLLLLAVAFPAEAAGGGGGGKGNLKPWQCSSKCASRCSGTQYKKACLTYCNKCCATCLCVPPGLYGNKAACPCYNNWKTKEGGPKCP